MNKNILTLAIIAAISGPLLSACGGSDSDSDSSSSTPIPELLSSPFVDGLVAALPYECLDATQKLTKNGVTDEQGNFSYNKGDTCYFSINAETQLGSVTLNTRADYLTPYSLVDTATSVRIASLLQTMDTDGDHANGITLKSDDLVKLPAIDLTSDDAFEQSMATALSTAELTQTYQFVEIETAADNMDQAIAEQEKALSEQAGGYYSQKVDEVVQLIANEEGNNWEGTNFQEDLAKYKQLLSEKDSSNGKDKEMMQALITLMEVTNDPIVASRITPDNRAGYTDMLPQVLEMILQGSTFKWNEPKNITTDMADLMGKYAIKAAEAADMIARSFNNPNRIAVYGTDDEFVINYDQAMAIQASAMALASALNIFAAYDYGDDKNYLPKQFEGTVATVEDSVNYSTGVHSVTTGEYTVSAEYMPLSIYTYETAAQENVLKLRPEAPTYLAQAKEQLAISAELTTKLQCNLYEYEMESDGNSTVTKREPHPTPEQDCSYYLNDEIRASVDELNNHLRNPQKQPTVTLYPRTNEDGSYDLETFATMDLNVFFDSGVDRSSFTMLETPKTCSYEVNGEQRTGSATEQDLGMSIAVDGLACALTASEVEEVINSDYFDLAYIETRYEEDGTRVDIFAQGGDFLHEATFEGKPNSTFDKMMITCMKDGEEKDCLIFE